MTLTLTPEQFAKAVIAIQTSKEVSAHTETANAGTVTAHGVSFSYQYDGAQNLSFQVTEKHGILAEHAPESVIDNHVKSFFASL